MKYGKDLISLGASTTRTPAITAVIFANLRGTARIKSVCAMAKIVGTKNGIGISYMYFGAWQSKDGSSGHEFHVGPHLMIVSPRQDDFQGFNRDPSNGMPYAAHLPHRTELYLVIPVRQWDE
jgi:hypothetical protein